MSRSPRVWPVFVAFVVALVVSALATGVAMYAMGGGASLAKGGAGGLRALLGGAIAAELTLIGTALLFARPFTLARLGLRRGRATAATAGVTVLGTLALAQTLDSLITLTLPHHSRALEAIAGAVAGARGPSLAAAVLVIGGMPGAAEELFFRGLTQTRLAERWRPWVAVLVTSVLFGLMHLDPIQSTLALGLGLWLGHASIRSGSILPAMLAHATNNALYTLLAAAGLGSESVGLNAVVGVISVAVFAACALSLGKLLPPQQAPAPEMAPI
jgi:membrane protease YdiL (CAAX protease family)